MTVLAIISDIHGCATSLEACLKHIEPLQPVQYLLLGDVLNHGPRNPVPAGYAPARVAEWLNERRGKIIAVRGNCDSEVDQMMLQFPCLAPYNFLLNGSQRVCMTHGHLYPLDQLALQPGDLVLSGHTHLAGFSEPLPGVLAFNPGSITFPRNQTEASFGLFRGGEWQLVSLTTGKVLERRTWPA